MRSRGARRLRRFRSRMTRNTEPRDACKVDRSGKEREVVRDAPATADASAPSAVLAPPCS